MTTSLEALVNYGNKSEGENMKIIILMGMMLTNLALAETISGEISIKGDAPKGVLYIFAKKFDGKMPMPLAVKKIVNPKFPVKFELDQSDAMLKNIPFIGPFTVTARISPSGSATDRSGIEASTKTRVENGEKNIKLILSK